MRSMTGFASEMQSTSKYDIFIELKSVNSRYFEFKVKSSYYLNELEVMIRNIISEKLNRGKIDLFIKVVEKNADNYEVVVNKDLAKKYEKALLDMGNELGVVSELSVRDFMSLEGIINLERVGEEEELEKKVIQMLEKLIERIIEMMYREGRKTKEDIESSLARIDESVRIIENLYPQSLEKYKESLRERLQEMIASHIDENRLMMELEMVASRTAINEEVVRLKSHIGQFQNVLNGKIHGDSKKLDFIGQEMNREANTIASKSTDYTIIENTIVIKGEIEKIREQLRNLV
ncbi:MAG: YicC family protein [Spirochaetes bacterium GWF1_51_8]|nr:MAG: YicC family protein [Spirochaetes bacterium GWF1_51_8]